MTQKTVYIKTGLTGGSSSDLDSLVGAGIVGVQNALADGDVCFVFQNLGDPASEIATDNWFSVYLFDADNSSPEDSPTIILPNSQVGGVGAWVLQKYSARYINPASSDGITITSDSGEIGLFVSDAGLVGIGTENPINVKLHVKGDMTVSGENGNSAILNIFADRGDNLDDKRRITVEDSGDFNIESYSTGSWTKQMTIENGGNVGIGTDSPGTKLDVETSGATAVGHFRNSNVDGYGVSIQTVDAGSDKYALFVESNDTNTIGLWVGNDGNIGIGTASPDQDTWFNSNTPTITVGGETLGTSNYGSLELCGNNSANDGKSGALSFLNRDNSGAGSTTSKIISMILSSIETTDSNAGEDSGGNLRFYTKAEEGLITERMRVAGSGNVGIGTTSPDTLFHVESGGETTTRISGDRGAGDSLPIANIEFENINSSNGVIAEIGSLTGITTTQNTKGQLYFSVDNGTSLTEAMRIDQNGNVGIGTTSPGSPLVVESSVSTATLASTPLLQLRSTANGTTNVGPEILFSGDIAGDGSTPVDFASIQGIKENSSTPSDYSSALRFGTRVSGSAIVEQMRISSSGNVGIGTASPDTKLQVGGTGGVSNSSNAAIFIGNTPAHLYDQGQLDVRTQEAVGADKGAMISLGGNSLTNNTPYNFGIIGAYKDNATSENYAGHMIFGTSDVYSNVYERMRIDSSGNVGIGTTSPGAILDSGATAKLQIGDGTADTYMSIKAGTNGIAHYSSENDAQSWRWGTASDDKFQLWDDTSNATRLIVDTSGNVGIGTTSPDTHFHVESGGETEIRISGDRGAGDSLPIANIEFENINSSNGVIAEIGSLTGVTTTQNTKGQLYFSVDNGTSLTEAMRIDQNGNVGIGTTSPDGTLHINGGNYNDQLILQGEDASSGIMFKNSSDTVDGYIYAATSSIGFLDDDANWTVQCYTDVYTALSCSDVEGLRINPQGTVAIGNTTPETWSSIVGKIALGGMSGISSEIVQEANQYLYLSNNAYLNENDTWTFMLDSLDQGSLLRVGNGGMTFFTAGAGSGTISFNTAFNIDNTAAITMPYAANDAVSNLRATYWDSTTGQIGYDSSVRSHKTNIYDLDEVSWIYDLRPVTFNRRTKDPESETGYSETEFYSEVEYGLIAEEVKEINEDFVFYSPNREKYIIEYEKQYKKQEKEAKQKNEKFNIGKIDPIILPEEDMELAGVHYDRLIPVLLKAIQDLKQEIENLKFKIK